MSVLPVVLGVVSSIGNAHPKDVERLGRNQAAFAKAATGDDNALKFLLYRSGQASHVNGYCTFDGAYMGSLGSQDPKRIPVEGWPTATTREDAKKKYNSALTARQQIGQTLTGVGVGVGVGSQGETTDDFLGGLASKLPSVPGWLFPALAIGAAVFVWYAFFRKGR